MTAPKKKTVAQYSVSRMAQARKKSLPKARSVASAARFLKRSTI